MAGPTPKPRDKRARRNRDAGTTSTSVELPPAEVVAELVHVPPASPHWPAWLVAGWSDWWATPAAAMLRREHLPAMRRLFDLYGEIERWRQYVDAVHKVGDPNIPGRVVELPGHLAYGSAGQLVESAESKILTRARAEARALEDRFGGSPMATFRLGWQQAAAVGEAARAAEAVTLAQAAQRIAEAHGQALEAAQ